MKSSHQTTPDETSPPTPCLRRVLFGHTVMLTALTVALFIVLSVLRPDQFLSLTNLQSMAFQSSEVGILALAMALAILLAGIDLSIVAIANLASILAAFFMLWADGQGLPTPVVIGGGILIGLAVGACGGAVNGFLVGVVGVSAILTTLATMTLFTGVAIGITNGSSVSRMPEAFSVLGNGVILGIPVPAIIFAVLAAATWIVLESSRVGVSIYLLGSNPRASLFSGIPTGRFAFGVHVVIGLFAAIAGLIVLSRTNSANAEYGGSYILTTILIVALGGVSVLGGRGRIIGVVVATLLLQVVSTGFNMLLAHFSGGNFFKDFVWGLLLLLVIAAMYLLRQGSATKGSITD